MTDIRRDTGRSTAMQYEKWQAARKAKEAATPSRAKRVMHSPALVLVAIWVGLPALGLAVLWWIGALAPFLGK
jgi:hypothetical protein